MSATLKIAMTPQSLRLIERHQQRATRLREALSGALRQGLEEAGAHVQDAKLSGTWSPGKRTNGQTPVNVRSSSLRRSIMSHLDQPLSGFVGSRQGEASAYAATILGDETTVIRPKTAGHLWIPIADNLTSSGQTKRSPREAMSITNAKGKRALRIFKSKAGNLVAFLPTGGRFKRATKGGRKKGDVKGELLFVLKKQVTVKGTGALAEGVEEKRAHRRATPACFGRRDGGHSVNGNAP